MDGLKMTGCTLIKTEPNSDKKIRLPKNNKQVANLRKIAKKLSKDYRYTWSILLSLFASSISQVISYSNALSRRVGHEHNLK